MATGKHPNRFLDSLGDEEFERVRPHLRPLELKRGEMLFNAGDTIKKVYFPHTAALSLVIDMEGGERIEAAMIGRDGILGATSVLDGELALSSCIVQIEGTASTLAGAKVREFALQDAEFLTTLIRHQEALFAQAQQSAACNALHTVEARLARWLLRTNDLTQGEPMPLTHEFLSDMLGVRRPSVSVAASTLQNAGLIRYQRGRIEILDEAGLHDASCECYETVKRIYHRLINQPD